MTDKLYPPSKRVRVLGELQPPPYAKSCSTLVSTRALNIVLNHWMLPKSFPYSNIMIDRLPKLQENVIDYQFSDRLEASAREGTPILSPEKQQELRNKLIETFNSSLHFMDDESERVKMSDRLGSIFNEVDVDRYLPEAFLTVSGCMYVVYSIPNHFCDFC